MNRVRPRRLAVAQVVAVLAAMLLAGAAVAQAAPRQKIEGSGSSWAANAVNQWIADVTSSGLQVVFTSQGSAQGRKDFANRTTDFAVSDIGFRGKDPATGDEDTSGNRAFAYLPIVAGGTSFPYNLTVGGKRVTNLRLSGETLAKIFTNQITSWSDPQITRDNNGRAFPSIPIIPLVHSEGSGSTAQFTTYLDTVYPSIWRPYYGRSGFTEYYPKKGGNMIAQNGSDQIINYTTSRAANGVITYDEYSYALAKNFPVVRLRNAAGYYRLPTQYNVAVALTQAKINSDKSSPDYLLQDLRKVYTYSDSRTYPLSSYSYMIIPTGPTDTRMSTAKRQSLVDYLTYSICDGQQEMGPIGYSPLPLNLVQASFEQTAKLKAADKGVDLTNRNVASCRNPTFVAGQPSRNFLAEIAPKPLPCGREGAGPCPAGVDEGQNANPVGGKAPTGNTGAGAPGGGRDAGAPGTGPVGGSGSPGQGNTGGGGTGATGAPGGGTTGAPIVDPQTGEVVAAGGAGSGIDAQQVGVVTDVAASSAVPTSVSVPLALAVLILAIGLPPVVATSLRRVRRR